MSSLNNGKRLASCETAQGAGDFLFSAPCSLFPNDATIVAAVSGGADSIFLAESLYREKLRLATCETVQSADNSLLPTAYCPLPKLIIAHVNHNLRGAESDADEQFVRDWVSQRQPSAPWLHGEFTKLHIQTDSDGLENACRTARYNWLTDVCKQAGARYLYTAHNADDQVETVLYRILRGSGLDGLKGIAQTRELTYGITLVRPLLNWTKKQILDQLAIWNQPYRTDSSNLTSDYARNKIRNELLPLLESEYNASVRSSILKLSSLACQASDELDKLTESALRNAIVRQNQDEIVLDRRSLRSVSAYIAMECFRKLWKQNGLPEQSMGLDQWTLLAEMAQSDELLPPYVFPGSVRACVTQELLTLEIKRTFST